MRGSWNHVAKYKGNQTLLFAALSEDGGVNAQLNLSLGRRRRDAGKNAVSEHNKWFLITMRSYAKYCSLSKGETTIDDLRIWAEENEIYPDHPNTWGCVFHGKHWHVIFLNNVSASCFHLRQFVFTKYASFKTRDFSFPGRS